MAEAFGVEGRGAFYDSVGALRDVVQNHLLQVVALLAMEPPVGPESRHLSDEKEKVFAATTSIDPATVVRGRFEGYLDEPGVAPDSTTETYVACTLWIESWRWAGVPFHIRAGKHLAETATEVIVELKRPPAMLFAEEDGDPPAPNLIRFRLGNPDGVTLSVNAKEPGPDLDAKPVELRVDYATALGERQEAYERLIGDAIDGDRRRFGRQDIVEETWRIVQPVLDSPTPVVDYAPGSWGPETDVAWFTPEA
jgi:glucose-6-phosphate 1-dehydrogenase